MGPWHLAELFGFSLQQRDWSNRTNPGTQSTCLGSKWWRDLWNNTWDMGKCRRTKERKGGRHRHLCIYPHEQEKKTVIGMGQFSPPSWFSLFKEVRVLHRNKWHTQDRPYCQAQGALTWYEPSHKKKTQKHTHKKKILSAKKCWLAPTAVGIDICHLRWARRSEEEGCMKEAGREETSEGVMMEKINKNSVTQHSMLLINNNEDQRQAVI